MASAGIPYAWVEKRVRPAAAPGRSNNWLILEAAVVLVVSVILAYILYEAQFSGSLRWDLASALIAGLAGYAWFVVTRRTSDPPLLAPDGARAQVQTGELTTLGAAVARANAGLPYSQVSVSSRARDAFALRLALATGRSPEAMRQLERDKEGLKAALHDAVLEDFLYLRSSEHDERYRWVREARDRGGFESALREVLERMEAWR